jgi:catechol 2,3-dioxygenase-like lactoylglutathione lyase family enzyme
MIQRIDHINMVVHDLPRLTAFYRDLVGLTVTREITIRGDWIESITGLKDVVADVVYLEADRGAGLELIHYLPLKEQSPWANRSLDAAFLERRR